MKLHRKIDIYQKTSEGLVYVASTKQSRTCREACITFSSRNNPYFVLSTGRLIMPGQFKPEELRAYFDKHER